MDNLHQRDRVGVDDCVLLDNHRDRELFVNNLRKRFNEDIIYVSIILHSLNVQFILILFLYKRHTLARFLFRLIRIENYPSIMRPINKVMPMLISINFHRICK